MFVRRVCMCLLCVCARVWGGGMVSCGSSACRRKGRECLLRVLVCVCSGGMMSCGSSACRREGARIWQSVVAPPCHPPTLLLPPLHTPCSIPPSCLLQALETFVVRCPQDARAHLPQILPAALEFLKCAGRGLGGGVCPSG